MRFREAVEREGFQLDEGIAVQLDDERSARAVSGRPEHGPRVAQARQSGIRGVSGKALDETAGKAPNHVRFVTYTTRYNNAHWVTVEGLEESYKRADVDAKRTDDMKQYTVTTKNVSRVRFDVPAASFTIDGQTLKAGANPAFEKIERQVGGRGRAPAGLRKIHGLQGPIEDAFTDGFLAVRGTRPAVERGRAQLREPALRQLQVASSPSGCAATSA